MLNMESRLMTSFGPSLGDLCGPSTAVLEDAQTNISEAQNKQMTNYANKQLHGAVPDLVPAMVSPAQTPLPIGKPVSIPDQNRSNSVPASPDIVIAPQITPVSTAAPNIAVGLDMPANSTAVLQPDILDKNQNLLFPLNQLLQSNKNRCLNQWPVKGLPDL